MKRATASWLGLLALLLPSIVLAQIDPDPNGVGIYFDQGATQAVTTAPVPTPPGTPVEVHAWLIATRCSLAGQVLSWEGAVRTDDYASMVVGHPTAGQNIAMNMPGSNSWSFNVWIDPQEPFVITQTLVLADLAIFLDQGDVATLLFINGAHIAVSDTGVLLHPSSGAEELPVAVINGAAPVPVAAGTWGAVKSLYGR